MRYRSSSPRVADRDPMGATGAEHVQIRTAQNVALDVETAGLGGRLAASLIDYTILGAYFIAALLVLSEIAPAGAGWATQVAIFLPVFLYFLLCEVLMNGQSIGKRVMKIKVARLDGRPPTLGNYIIRWLIRPVDVTLTSGLAGTLSILLTRTGQRLGDLAAGTTVIRVRPRTALSDTLFVDIEPGYTPQFEAVRRLDAKDVLTAKDVIKQLRGPTSSPSTEQLAARLKSILERKMNITSDLPPLDFLETVAKDYNHVHGVV